MNDQEVHYTVGEPFGSHDEPEAEPEDSSPVEDAEWDVAPVRVIQRNGPTVLIEWTVDGLSYRGYVPNAVIEDGWCAWADLVAAQPYGLRWEELVEIDGEALARKIAQELYRRGAWTAQDLRRPNTALSAYQAALSDSVHDLQRRAAKAQED